MKSNKMRSCPGCSSRDSQVRRAQYGIHVGYARECLGCGWRGPVRGSKSAATRAWNKRTDPRSEPCPECGRPEILLPAEAKRGYVCDDCANKTEGGK